MALPQAKARTRKAQKDSLAPYLFHFGLFVAVFFAIIGGALFILNFASAYAA
jgi:choline-glycine betaine transporter